MSESNLDAMDMDDLLDSTLDDLEDLPSFTPYPVGAHRVLATFEEKEEKINGKDAIELSFKLIETVELADENDVAPAEGDVASTLFFLDNKYGRGNLKRCAKPFGEALNFTTAREIVEGVKDVECLIITGLAKNKNDPDKPYLDVKEIEVV